ncbi:MAG: hypothetical protein GTN40_03755 [Candidatus Aenigmarchaeota archaeon]|nr:hypothetical protein [Candidatus Aenigmarchaeota archaeon]
MVNIYFFINTYKENEMDVLVSLVTKMVNYDLKEAFLLGETKSFYPMQPLKLTFSGKHNVGAVFDGEEGDENEIVKNLRQDVNVKLPILTIPTGYGYSRFKKEGGSEESICLILTTGKWNSVIEHLSTIENVTEAYKIHHSNDYHIVARTQEKIEIETPNNLSVVDKMLGITEIVYLEERRILSDRFEFDKSGHIKNHPQDHLVSKFSNSPL